MNGALGIDEVPSEIIIQRINRRFIVTPKDTIITPHCVVQSYYVTFANTTVSARYSDGVLRLDSHIPVEGLKIGAFILDEEERKKFE